jgi:hypothetical protein
MVQKVLKVHKVVLDQMEQLDRKAPLDQQVIKEILDLQVQPAQQAQLDRQDRQGQKEITAQLAHKEQKVQLVQLVQMEQLVQLVQMEQPDRKEQWVHKVRLEHKVVLVLKGKKVKRVPQDQ